MRVQRNLVRIGHPLVCRYALTGREVTAILMQRLVKVDGKVRTDTTYPAGFMDVIQIEKTEEHFRWASPTRPEPECQAQQKKFGLREGLQSFSVLTSLCCPGVQHNSTLCVSMPIAICWRGVSRQ